MTTAQFDTLHKLIANTMGLVGDDAKGFGPILRNLCNEAGIEVKDPAVEWKLLRADGHFSCYLPDDFENAFAECEFVRNFTPTGDRRRIIEIQCFENGELVAKYDPVDGSRRWQKGEPNT